MGMNMNLELDGLTSVIHWGLSALLAGTGTILVLVAIWSVGRRFPEVVGSLTVGTVAEPLGNAVLDRLAELTRVMWAVADALHPSRAKRANG